MKPDRALQHAREAKHRMFMAKKVVLNKTRPQREAVRDSCIQIYAHLFPYSPGRHGLAYELPTPVAHTYPPISERRIFAFWTGTNDMTKNRLEGLASLRKHNPDTSVILVTPDTLQDWVIPTIPLHSSYELLSHVHKADYLRCYFMHHYGGGYADLKRYDNSWTGAFDRLNEHPSAVAMGYHETKSSDVAILPGRLGIELRLRYRLLIGKGAFIMRPKTVYTALWWHRVKKAMDSAASDLADHPGDARGENPGYPIRWTGMLGDLLDPLSLAFSPYLLHDDALRPRFTDYR